MPPKADVQLFGGPPSRRAEHVARTIQVARIESAFRFWMASLEVWFGTMSISAQAERVRVGEGASRSASVPKRVDVGVVGDVVAVVGAGRG